MNICYQRAEGYDKLGVTWDKVGSSFLQATGEKLLI